MRSDFSQQMWFQERAKYRSALTLLNLSIEALIKIEQSKHKVAARTARKALKRMAEHLEE